MSVRYGCNTIDDMERIVNENPVLKKGTTVRNTYYSDPWGRPREEWAAFNSALLSVCRQSVKDIINSMDGEQESILADYREYQRLLKKSSRGNQLTPEQTISLARLRGSPSIKQGDKLSNAKRKLRNAEVREAAYESKWRGKMK